MPPFDDEEARVEGPISNADYQDALHRLNVATQTSDASPINSPARMGVFDWMDFPGVVVAYANSFPHNGPVDKRDKTWERQTQPRTNPKTKQPSGPNEGVLLS